MRTLTLILLCIFSITVFAQSNSEVFKSQFNEQASKQSTVLFEENKGQLKDQYWQPRPDVLYYGNMKGMNYYIRNNGISYQLSEVACWQEVSDVLPKTTTKNQQIPEEENTYRVDVDWLRHNSDFTVKQGKELEGYNNYYNVAKGTEPALYVKKYEAITLDDVWNGINIHYYSTNGLLETDYIVAPGADYRQVRMEIKGADLSINKEGILVMKTPYGEIHEGQLKVYQDDKLIPANWVIIPTYNGGIVSFDIPSFDPCLALRIDPLVRVWGTLYGGIAEELAYDCHVDGNGNVYLTGQTSSSTSIASGGHQNLQSYQADAFLVKFNSNGTRLWGTYYGGLGSDAAFSCVTDASGNIHMAGNTDSEYIMATAGSHQDTLSYNGQYPTFDAFLVKFNSSGIRQWATYFGGDGPDDAQHCAIDPSGFVYICGSTSSSNGINKNGHQSTYGGGAVDGFLAKFSNSGGLVWATYYGGLANDRAYACAAAANGDIFLSGETNSSTNMSSPVSHVTTFDTLNTSSFLAKFNSSGARQWATYYGGFGAIDCSVDGSGNCYITGTTTPNNYIAFNGHQNSMLPPGPLGGPNWDAYLAKFDPSGNRLWGTYYGGNYIEEVMGCSIDNAGNVYITGNTVSSMGIAQDGYQNILAPSLNAFLAKFDPLGVQQWGTYIGGGYNMTGSGCAVGPGNVVYVSGWTMAENHLPYNGHQNTHNGLNDGFLLKFNQDRVSGLVWQDLDNDCMRDASEIGRVNNLLLTIQPGNYTVQTHGGTWSVDSLPAGTYTITIDTTNHNWLYTCPISQTFTVSNPQGVTVAPPFGLKPKYACPSPNVSITMPFIRRGFSNQQVMVKACNLSIGSDSLQSAYIDIQLDTNLLVQSASLPYTTLGFNQFRVNLGTILMDECVDMYFLVTVKLSTVTGQTLCMSADLFPQPGCSFDSIPYQPLLNANTSPCNQPFDNSLLSVSASCSNDSVNLIVYNNGSGNMACFAPILIFLDAQIYLKDSVQLGAGDSMVYRFPGEELTWHIQTAQHPLNFVAEPYPIASMERCGTGGTWTPLLVNALPRADLHPVYDEFCGIVTSSYDPNDKTGFPLGVGASNDILPNQEIEYLIRFQNTGTDTAINIILRDTLSQELDIFTVESGVGSHPYTFRIYGQRILEWRFDNIRLPDSTTNELGSHGFVTFRVQQTPTLADGTVIENNVGIYFDFEAPVITNTYTHTVQRVYPTSPVCLPTTSTTSDTACTSYTWNGQTYTTSGIYTFQTTNTQGCDSTATLELIINSATTSTTSDTACGSYTWNGQTYTTGGTYTFQTTNAQGCDSTAILNLVINSATTSTTFDTACGSYTWNGQTYTTGGTYTYQTTNAQGCDSVAILELSINSATTSTTNDTACGSYSWNGQTYTASGTYTFQTTNAQGCDSTAILNLVINSATTSTTFDTACGSYTWNGQTYTTGGTYTYQTTNAQGCDSTATLEVLIVDDFMDTDTIAGVTFVDTSQTYTYSIPTGAVGDNFYWSLSCGNIVNGIGTNSIEVNWNGIDSCMLWVVRSNTVCADTLELTVTMDSGTGMEQWSLSKVSLYPNPTTSNTFVSWGTTLQEMPQVHVLDAWGKLVHINASFNSNGGLLETQLLPTGVYSIVLAHPSGVTVKKLVKAE